MDIPADALDDTAAEGKTRLCSAWAIAVMQSDALTAEKRNAGGNGDTWSNLREEAFQVCWHSEQTLWHPESERNSKLACLTCCMTGHALRKLKRVPNSG